MSDQLNTVIVTSFWNRPLFLKGLHFSSRRAIRNKWRMLVVDNGSIAENKDWLYSWSEEVGNVTIVHRDAYSKAEDKRMSSAEHGAALDIAMQSLEGSKELIVISDSDVIFMMPRWDEFIAEKLKSYDHITTHRKASPAHPAPYLSAFYMDFIKNNSIKFAPRVNEKLEVIRPTNENDVGWQLNALPKERWGMLTHAAPGLGYSRALSIKFESELIAEHLYAGRKRKEGRIKSWMSMCMSVLENNKKILREKELIKNTNKKQTKKQ